MNAQVPTENHTPYSLIKRNTQATQVLSEPLEKQLIGNMDQVLFELCQTLFLQDATHEAALELFSELIIDKGSADEATLDQWLTLRDILLLHSHLGKSRQHESAALIHLAAQWIVNWPVDRSALFERISQLQALFAPVEQALVKSLLRRYTQIRNQLVNANLRLVAHLAGRYREKGLDVEELIQEGTLGVIQAANRFNASLGNRFTTYAYWWIQQALKQALSDKRGAVRLPTNVTDRISFIERHKEAFIRQHGRMPNLDELQKISGLDKAVLQQFQQIGNLGVSLNSPIHENDDDEAIDFLSDQHRPVDEEIEQLNQQASIKQLLQLLSERQRHVVSLYYGIGGHEPLTFREIAPIIGITLERCRQIYHESLSKIKTHLTTCQTASPWTPSDYL